MQQTSDTELRFLRCKGAHASCELCLNAAKLLEARGKRKFNNKGREIIRLYRSLHLDQQAAEREELRQNRERARNGDFAFIFGDFMSEWTTKLPHVKWNDRSSNEDSGPCIGTRVYAAQVIYKGFFCYVVPGYLPGGKSSCSSIITL